MNINQTFTKVDNVSQDLLDVFLEPYKENCKYLKKAQFQEPEQSHLIKKSNRENQGLWFIKADFSIPESCYIDDTGHFNSVEFNICYNQLFYILIAYLVKNNLLDVMKNWNLKTYKRRQLNDFLIVNFSSAFKKPINSRKFQGTLSINRCSTRSNLIILKTSCAFYDDNGGWSEGDVTIAVLNSQPEETIDGYHETVVA
ncbi:MAG: FcoT family thioesterase [Scytonema sp. PMC 1069.18]|nr:FcoT family thioesterase [Scytonema sp. PMC 1069.18]MEC4883510.1 FcoT family thioesterase [Scytonema sp. PMC 1070.18]